jgi:hypothetical protein
MGQVPRTVSSFALQGDFRVHRTALRPWLTALLSIALSCAVVAVAPFARADAKTEGAAKQLESKAMQEDYLATDFDKALDKLNQAAGKCGTDKCSSLVRAQIKRDVGVVQIGKQSREAAIAAFTDALHIDSNVTLDPDTRTKELDAAWAEAKKQAAASAPASGAGAPGGDFTVQTPPATLVRVPLDIYGEYTGTEQLAKVVLKYKSFGMPDWKTVEMKELGKGWGAEIVCADVAQGDLLFYVQGFNANNDPVATSGDRNSPYKTSVKRDYAGELPHFPGKDAPKQCAEAGDCPPDFPGCKKDASGSSDSSLKDDGADCEEDGECKSGTCNTDKTCASSEGGEAHPKRRKFWVGVEWMYDFLAIPSGGNVCHLSNLAVPGPDSNGYYCTSGGNDYPSRNDNGAQNGLIQANTSDKVAGGFAPGNMRLLVSFDYALTNNLLVGAKVGYVTNTYDGTAAKNEGKAFAPPIHLEARGTYVFGKDALARAGLAPYALIAVGLAQYSASVGVTVVETTEPAPVQANAWKMTGPGFAAVGAGLRFAVTPRFAVFAGPRFNLAFGPGGTLPSLSPEIAVGYGF